MLLRAHATIVIEGVITYHFLPRAHVPCAVVQMQPACNVRREVAFGTIAPMTDTTAPTLSPIAPAPLSTAPSAAPWRRRMRNVAARSIALGMLAVGVTSCSDGAIGAYVPLEEHLEGENVLDNAAVVSELERFHDDVALRYARTSQSRSVGEYTGDKEDIAALARITHIQESGTPGVYFAVTRPDVTDDTPVDATHAGAYVLRIDTNGGDNGDTAQVTRVAELQLPPGYVERMHNEARAHDSSTLALTHGWSMAPLRTFDPDTRAIVPSQDAWLSLGGVGVQGAHIADDGTRFTKMTDPLPQQGQQPNVGMCTLDDAAGVRELAGEYKDADTQTHDDAALANATSALGSAAIIAASGMPALSVYDPVTMAPRGNLVLRTVVDGADVGTVDTVDMAKRLGIDTYAPDEDRNPITDVPLRSVVNTALVAGVTDVACVPTGAANEWGFAQSKRNHPAILGLVDDSMRASFIRNIVTDKAAGDPTLEVAAFHNVEDKQYLTVIDSRTGVVTGVVTLDAAKLQEGDTIAAFDVDVSDLVTPRVMIVVVRADNSVEFINAEIAND